MSKLTRFLATSLLVISMSAVALADGNTQGPGIPPPDECTENCTVTEATAPAPEASSNVVDEMATLVTCLLESIF